MPNHEADGAVRRSHVLTRMEDAEQAQASEQVQRRRLGPDLAEKKPLQKGQQKTECEEDNTLHLVRQFFEDRLVATDKPI